MQELKEKATEGDEEFTPEEQGDRDNLIQLVISGDLVRKFLASKLSFPKIPRSFKSHAEYEKYWLYLLQYEIFSKLLSRSSNKRQKIDVEKDLDEDIEEHELLKQAAKDKKTKTKTI